MVRRTVWEALGGLDPTFSPAWWEDVDFCARLGYRLGDDDFPCAEGFFVQPSARFRHIGGSSVASLGDTVFLETYYRNLLHYATRHHAHVTRFIRLGLRCSLASRMVLRPSRRAAYRAALNTVTGA
jgi:GT2 family glycosyltransferase